MKGETRSNGEILAAGGLLVVFALLLSFVVADGIGAGGGPVERELRHVARVVETARACDLSEAAISRFVKARMDALLQNHPDAVLSQLVVGLVESLDIAPPRTPPSVAECARAAERIAAA
jgi:hypothetical protein